MWTAGPGAPPRRRPRDHRPGRLRRTATRAASPRRHRRSGRRTATRAGCAAPPPAPGRRTATRAGSPRRHPRWVAAPPSTLRPPPPAIVAGAYLPVVPWPARFHTAPDGRRLRAVFEGEPTGWVVELGDRRASARDVHDALVELLEPGEGRWPAWFLEAATELRARHPARPAVRVPVLRLPDASRGPVRDPRDLPGLLLGRRPRPVPRSRLRGRREPRQPPRRPRERQRTRRQRAAIGDVRPAAVGRRASVIEPPAPVGGILLGPPGSVSVGGLRVGPPGSVSVGGARGRWAGRCVGTAAPGARRLAAASRARLNLLRRASAGSLAQLLQRRQLAGEDRALLVGAVADEDEREL
jgi:hypothetical protein